MAKNMNFERICRLCLNEKPSLTDIFSSSSSNKRKTSKVHLCDKIMSCASLVLYDGDGLPRMICNKCLLSVNESYAFRMQCEESEKKLRLHLQKFQESQGNMEEINDENHVVFKVEAADQSAVSVPGDDYEDMGTNENVDDDDEEALSVNDTKPDGTSLPIAQPDDSPTKESDINTETTSKQCEMKMEVAVKKEPFYVDDESIVFEIENDAVEHTNDVENEMEKVAQPIVISQGIARSIRTYSIRKPMYTPIGQQIFKSVTRNSNVGSCDKISVKKYPSDEINFKITNVSGSGPSPKNLGTNSDDPDNSSSTRSNRVRCKLCLTWVSRPTFYLHMKKSHEQQYNKITQKRNQESSLVLALKEYADDTGGNHVLCKVCNILMLRTSFLNHVKYVHHKVKNHLCTQCGYRTTTAYILQQHILAVHTDNTFTCKICNKTYNSKSGLKSHNRKEHSDSRKVYICDFCGKKLRTRDTFKRHFFIHSGEKPYVCKFCGRRFTGRFARKSHENLHTGTKPYKCTKCDMAFTQNVVRKHHEFKVHGNEEFNPIHRKKKEVQE